jgi:hypothetical protein
LSVDEVNRKMLTAVNSAALARSDVTGYSTKAEEFTEVFILPCGFAPLAIRWQERGWSYAKGRDFIGWGVAGYEPNGSSVVEEIRQELRTGKTWTSPDDSLRYTMVGEMAVTRPAGVDNSVVDP